SASTEPEEESEVQDEATSDAELKSLKRELGALKKRLKADRSAFGQRLSSAAAELDVEGARRLVLDALGGELVAQGELRVERSREAVLHVVETWWSKYRVTLRDLEARRTEGSHRLDAFLTELGYD
ncbi:MAG: SAM-dependent DNA methyltransferase, partial [Acidobacteria bacterium]|nr:SAM-dependent DNA methyltransferase [Acidobacteriota bacterium]